MNKVKSFLIVFFLLALSASSVFAQFNWPDDPALRDKATEKNVLYTDDMKAGNYLQAAKNLRWLLDKTPELSVSLYQNGAKIYEALAEDAEGKATELAYIDTALTMYDLRVKYFGQEDYVMDRKAFTAYKFLKGHPKKYEDVYNMLGKAYELNGEEMMDINAVFYLDMARRYSKVKPDAVSDAEALEVYDKASGVLEYKKSLGKNMNRIEKLQDNLDKILASTVDVDCDFIESNLKPKYKKDTTNLKLAKKIFQLQLQAKCSDSDLFLEVAKEIYRQEPTLGLIKVISGKSMAKEQWDVSIEYLNKGLEMAENDTEKAELYMDLGTSNKMLGNKAQARDYYLQSASLDPTNEKAYEQVGLLYYQSYEDCKKGENIVHDRAVYIAAYNMFRKAGNAELMQSMKEVFPSKEEIFTYDISVGDTYTIGCWINTTVTIDTRD